MKKFGNGDGRFWFDELECLGNETDLVHCKSSGLGNHDCWEYEAVGVICGMLMTLVIMTIKAMILIHLTLFTRTAFVPEYFDVKLNLLL